MRALVLWALLSLSSLAHALTAEAYIVVDWERGVLLEKNADEVRSIASITKLITASAAQYQDPQTLIQILPEDLRLGHMRRTPLRAGKSYTREELMRLALVSSDNVAAIALGRYIDGPPPFLPDGVRYVEASGLDEGNTATARELAQLAESLAGTPLAPMSTQPKATIGAEERSTTNPLIVKPGWEFLLSKTGYIRRAGGCLVAVVRAGERLLTFVVLGSRSVPDRWRDLQELRRLVDADAPPIAPVTGLPRNKLPRRRSHR